jgi:hypothetical protein
MMIINKINNKIYYKIRFFLNNKYKIIKIMNKLLKMIYNYKDCLI